MANPAGTFVKMPPILKQRTLRDILDKRRLVDGLKADLRAAEVDLAKHEELAMYALDTGVKVEAGALVAGVDTKESRRPAWKEEFARVAGPQAVEDVIAATVPTVTRKLVVLENGKATK